MIGTMNKRSPLMKAIGVFLAVCFMCYNVSFAAPDNAATAAAQEAVKAVITADDVGIAIDSGTIKARHNGQSGKIIVHIQDAHCNYEAQNNINKMLDQLTRECGIDIISVEGAEGIVDTTWFKAFPDAEIRKEVATYFMKKGEITGAEFFSITSDFNGTIFGAETRDYYIKNLKSFTAVYPYKESIEKYFTDTLSVVSKLKGLIYSPELRELDSKITAFDSKQVELSAFAEYLYKEVSRNKVKLEEYPNFKKLVETLEYEKKINFDVVDQERSAYIDFLSKKLTKEQMTNLVTQSINFKKGHIKAADFYSFLRDLAKEHNIPIVQEYPNLFYYYIYSKLYDGIDNEKLFKEMDAIELVLKKKLFKDPTQEELDRVSTLVDMYVNLVNIELTNEDYDLFKEYSAKTPLEAIVSFLDKQCRKYNLNCEIGEAPAQIRDNMPKMIDFYEIAIKRDNALIDNTLAQMAQEGKNRSVLIAGGFHTRGIKDLLEKQGVSYVVVTPKITKDVETPYIKVLTNQRTSLEDIITENASMPGMGITASREEIVRAKGSMLAPISRFFLIQIYVEEGPEAKTEQEQYQSLAEVMGAVVGGRAPKTVAEDTSKEMVRRLVTQWLLKVKKDPDTKPEVWAHAVENWQELMGAYLYQYEKASVALVKNIKPEFRDAAQKRATDAIARMVSDEFRDIFKAAVIAVTTPGQNAIDAENIKMENDEFGKALTEAQHDALKVVIKNLIDSGKAVQEKVSVGNIPITVYWLAGFEEAIIAHNMAGGVQLPANIVHPGRGVDHTGRNIYLSSKLNDDGPNMLTQDEKSAIFAHEKEHFLDPGKSEADVIKKLNQAKIIDDIRRKMMNIAKEVSAGLGSSLNLESTLLKDTAYGDVAVKHIQAAKAKIAGLKKAGDVEGAAKLEKELAEWMKMVQVRRGNIDRMRNVLTGETYNGYDVIIVSSSTEDEAQYQQEVLNKLFAGRSTSNNDMGNQVCILSVLDESEGGQIIGQGVTWLAAVEKYKKWAEERNKAEGLELATDLDSLFKNDKIKVSVYHNGGKGERASPATQSLGNSRGAQKIVGMVKAAAARLRAMMSKLTGTEKAKAEAVVKKVGSDEVGIELIPAVILSTAGSAITNNKSRVDTFWANQVGFGTIDFPALRRSNSQVDKYVMKVPADPEKKALFDYGTAIIDAAGRIIKFVANKVLAKKDKNGQWILNDKPEIDEATGKIKSPGYKKELDELFGSANGSFDFGSFSMSRDMHYALLEYWKNKGIFDKIAKTGKAGMARDIDPAFVQIIVPLMSGLIGKDLPAGLPTADQLKAVSGDAAKREAMLNDAYGKLVSVLEAEYASALNKVYNAQKKAKDGTMVLDKDKRDSVLESIEFFILYPQLFADREKVVGSIDLGADSHWFAYKRMLDLSNEKFLMLSDILGKNVELDTNGAVIETLLDDADLDVVRAEDTRRVRGITKDAVASFVVNGELITLSLDQVRAGWRDEKNDITVQGSIIHGNTVLMPGSRVINSVVSDSQGKINAENSYIETSTAKEINAANSIVYKVTDAGVVNANKEIVADAYRPEIVDPRFPSGQTRMRAMIGYDPKGAKENDETLFGDNKYTFKAIRDMECNRAANDKIENDNKDAVRIDAGMILPGMAAGLTYDEAYDYVAKEASDKGARIKAMDAKFKPLKNGTSGMRGPVTESEAENVLITPNMTPEQAADIKQYIKRMIAADGKMADMECYINVRGFIKFLFATGDIKPGAKIAFGGDLRPTTSRIALAVLQAIKDEGCVPDYVGKVSSPALAYYAMQNGMPSVMITGSHIPADRNGIKFTKVSGEVLKTDETNIAKGARQARNEVYGMKPEQRPFDEGTGMFKPEKVPVMPAYDENKVMDMYVQRYLSTMPADYLKDMTIAVYQHSAVGRDALVRILEGLGAKVIAIERSDVFVPVDTEKVSEKTKAILKEAAQKYNPDLIFSMDGDSDRPLFADEKGDFLTGDRLGGLVTQMLKPDWVAVPCTTNNGVLEMLQEQNIKVTKTKVGSPYIVAKLLAGAKMGWEANGGFILGSEVQLPGWKGALKPLPTRDAPLPLILAARYAKERGQKASEMIATALPPWYGTGVAVTDRTPGCESYSIDMGKAIMAKLSPSVQINEAAFTPEGVKVQYPDEHWETASPELAKELLALKDKMASYFTSERGFPEITGLETIDGVKVIFDNGKLLMHVRASGNAADFRGIPGAPTEAQDKELGAKWAVIGPEIVRGEGYSAAVPAGSPGLNAIRTMPAANTPVDRVVKSIQNGNPFVVKPYLEPKVWGENGIGEAWFGAEAGDKSSTVVVGDDEVPLAEVMKYVPEEFLGLGVVRNFGDTMPLVKILTPKDRLSMQFHDTKNELWIVMATNVENPTIVLGFSKEVTDEYGDKVAVEYGEVLKKYGVELNNLIAVVGKYNMGQLEKEKNVRKAAQLFLDKKLLAGLPALPASSEIHAAVMKYDLALAELQRFYNFRPVKVGDVIPIPSGTLHALGAGVTVYEPQIAGPTQSLEDGATYPVRYYFPGFQRPGSQKQLDIARVGELNTGVAIEQKPIVIREEAGTVVERLPGSFEDKGLEVHRITMTAKAEMNVPAVATFHNLVALDGTARVIAEGIEYDIPKASAKGEMLIIPATAKGYTIIADSNVKIVDTFTPVPETTEISVNVGPEISGTDSPSSEERLVFADFQGVTATFDQLYLVDGSMPAPKILLDRKHELLVREGTVRVDKIGKDGKLVPGQELVPGKKMEISAGFGRYALTKIGDRNAVVKVDYEKNDAEKAVYATYDAVRKHMREINAGQVDLILPAEMFVPGGKGTPGSAEWEEDQLRRYVSDTIRITTYSAKMGLKGAAKINVSPGAIGILVATESSLNEADKKDTVVLDFLQSKKGTVRVMAIPDIDKDKALEGQGWFFNREVEGTGLLLAAVTPEAIEEAVKTPGTGNAAEDLQKLMGQLTRKTVPAKYLYYMLSYNEIKALSEKGLIPATELKDLNWLRFIVQHLLLNMPPKPFDATEQLEQRRKVMWSV